MLSLVELAAGDSEALPGLCGVLRGARPDEPLTQLLCCALEASSRAVWAPGGSDGLRSQGVLSRLERHASAGASRGGAALSGAAGGARAP